MTIFRNQVYIISEYNQQETMEFFLIVQVYAYIDINNFMVGSI